MSARIDRQIKIYLFLHHIFLHQWEFHKMSIHNSQCKIRDVFYYAKSLSTELRDVNKEIGENSGLTWMKVPELFL